MGNYGSWEKERTSLADVAVREIGCLTNPYVMLRPCRSRVRIKLRFRLYFEITRVSTTSSYDKQPCPILLFRFLSRVIASNRDYEISLSLSLSLSLRLSVSLSPSVLSLDNIPSCVINAAFVQHLQRRRKLREVRKAGSLLTRLCYPFESRERRPEGYRCRCKRKEGSKATARSVLP